MPARCMSDASYLLPYREPGRKLCHMIILAYGSTYVKQNQPFSKLFEQVFNYLTYQLSMPVSIVIFVVIIVIICLSTVFDIPHDKKPSTCD